MNIKSDNIYPLSVEAHQIKNQLLIAFFAILSRL